MFFKTPFVTGGGPSWVTTSCRFNDFVYWGVFGERKYICNNASMNMFQIFILIQELLFAVTGWYDPIVYQHSYMKSRENCSLFPSIQKNLHVNMPRWWFQIFFGIFTPREMLQFWGSHIFQTGISSTTNFPQRWHPNTCWEGIWTPQNIPKTPNLRSYLDV